MATKTKKTNKRTSKKAKQQAQTQVYAVILFSLGLFFTILSLAKGSSGWLLLHNALMGVMGWSGFIIGPLMLYTAVMATFDKLSFDLTARLSMVILWLLMFATTVTLFTPDLLFEGSTFDRIKVLYTQGVELKGGGVISIILALPLNLLGTLGSRIVAAITLFALTMVITGTTLYKLISTAGKPVQKISEGYQESVQRISQAVRENPPQPLQRPKVNFEDFDVHQPAEPPKPQPSTLKDKLLKAAGVAAAEAPLQEEASVSLDLSEIVPTATPKQKGEEPQDQFIDDIIQRIATENIAQIKLEKEKTAAIHSPAAQPAPQESKVQAEPEPEITQEPPIPPVKPVVEYKLPPIDLLRQPAHSAQEQPVEELKQNAQRLVDTLMSFGVSTRIIDISRGPAVTRYELQPAAGVKISKITNLADDIALNLAAAGVRIEAPIPNKPAVGIEIPNKTISPVTLREVVDSKEFAASKSKVSVALGRDIAGNITVANIAKMPHMLIAGSTGSGKSVCINSLIMSILYKATPDQVKLLMVDPKVVELGIYNGLPHLLVPVVTDPKKAAGALCWAVNEMLTRYKLFAAHNVRDISGYNRVCEDNPELISMPHIVIIIDELSDLMMAAPNEVEDYICRLAQMARAAGMHLVIATQRPSVDVITGIIKANIPSRIAFAVSSQIDSRTILDMGGAEKLLGAGDMLYYPVGAAKPLRVQGCYVSDQEIESVVEFIKSCGESQYDETIMEEIEKQAVVEKSKDSGGGLPENEDEMMPDAIACVVEAGMASTSLLQRKLKLGYARAARIIDELEAKGIVGPFEGSKPRQVLISKERWMEMKLMNDR